MIILYVALAITGGLVLGLFLLELFMPPDHLQELDELDVDQNTRPHAHIHVIRKGD